MYFLLHLENLGLPETNLNNPDKPFFDLPVPRSQVIDQKKISDKINSDLGSNNNVLPKPDLTNSNDKLPSPTNLQSNASSFITTQTGEDPDPEIRHRRDVVREMTQHAWSNYVKYAWGENELNPILKTGHQAGIFGSTKIGKLKFLILSNLFII